MVKVRWANIPAYQSCSTAPWSFLFCQRRRYLSNHHISCLFSRRGIFQLLQLLWWITSQELLTWLAVENPVRINFSKQQTRWSQSSPIFLPTKLETLKCHVWANISFAFCKHNRLDFFCPGSLFLFLFFFRISDFSPGESGVHLGTKREEKSFFAQNSVDTMRHSLVSGFRFGLNEPWKEGIVLRWIPGTQFPRNPNILHSVLLACGNLCVTRAL